MDGGVGGGRLVDLKQYFTIPNIAEKVGIGGAAYFGGLLALKADRSLIPLPVEIGSITEFNQVVSLTAKIFYEAVLGVMLVFAPILVLQWLLRGICLVRKSAREKLDRYPLVYCTLVLAAAITALKLCWAQIPLRSDASPVLACLILEEASFPARLFVFGGIVSITAGFLLQVWTWEVRKSQPAVHLYAASVLIIAVFSIPLFYGAALKEHGWSFVSLNLHPKDGSANESVGGVLVGSDAEFLALLVPDSPACELTRRIGVKVLRKDSLFSITRLDTEPLAIFPWINGCAENPTVRDWSEWRMPLASVLGASLLSPFFLNPRRAWPWELWMWRRLRLLRVCGIRNMRKFKR